MYLVITQCCRSVNWHLDLNDSRIFYRCFLLPAKRASNLYGVWDDGCRLVCPFSSKWVYWRTDWASAQNKFTRHLNGARDIWIAGDGECVLSHKRPSAAYFSVELSTTWRTIEWSFRTRVDCTWTASRKTIDGTTITLTIVGRELDERGLRGGVGGGWTPLWTVNVHWIFREVQFGVARM